MSKIQTAITKLSFFVKSLNYFYMKKKKIGTPYNPLLTVQNYFWVPLMHARRVYALNYQVLGGSGFGHSL